MALSREFVEYAVEQIDEDCGITYRQMFGGFCLYSDGKVFGLVCYDQLFIKPTDGGRAFIGDPVEAPAYEGAKPSFLIEDQIEDREWLSQLVRITTRELPVPRRKKPEKPRGAGKR